ncbi:beta-galactosidase [Microbacterium gorillae]|uniref:beta-galactosidase n=1 Tax=Microbacterium gorillae TaxID=1231063 RepID=UPI00058BB3F9|nr:beta-galactosidase [Microbacterium gorillae]
MEHERSPRTRGVRFGAAYYAEYHRGPDRLTTDLDLMQAASFSVIRVGESVWSTWEPDDGQFDLDWLTPVLDGALERGIDVILGTPTYAVPPWLAEQYPEIAGEVSTGTRLPWGGRQEVDFTHAAFRFHAERVIRRILARHADHPAVIGIQVDNEPGLHLLHNHAVMVRFRRWLHRRYGDVQNLNDQWGLTYWSHLLSDWSQLWTPDGNTLPQYDLAWRRFQAEQTTDFLRWQADIAREYTTPGQFVTTCVSYPRNAVDDRAVGEVMDVAAGNVYFTTQDHLIRDERLTAPSAWATTGVSGLFRQADRLYSSKAARFLVTETNATSIDDSTNNLPPYPGQLRQAALALISRGAEMIEYWHWHTIPYGTETYWGGVLPHSLQPGRIYDEVAALGASLRRIGPGLDTMTPDADVAIIWSNDSRWALQYSPPFRTDAGPDAASYERIFDAFHRGVIDAGAQARILHVEQATALGADELVARHPVLVAPALYVADDDTLALLRAYAERGGHLVLGIRSGYTDDETRARVETAPAGLAGAAGVHYDEFSNLAHEVPVHADGVLQLPPDAAGSAWLDGLVLDDADTLATYDHPVFSVFPAITTRRHGRGRITVIGTLPNPALAAAVTAWAVPTPIAADLIAAIDPAVTISSVTGPDGARTWFVFNWSHDAISVTLRRAVTDLDGGAAHRCDDRLVLAPRSAVVLADT